MLRLDMPKQLRLMKPEPLNNKILRRKPTIDESRASCLHIHDYVLLSREVENKSRHDRKEAILDDAVMMCSIMRLTDEPNTTI